MEDEMDDATIAVVQDLGYQFLFAKDYATAREIFLSLRDYAPNCRLLREAIIIAKINDGENFNRDWISPLEDELSNLTESMKLSSDAQYPAAGTVTPDAPFPEGSPDARSQEGNTDAPAVKKKKNIFFFHIRNRSQNLGYSKQTIMSRKQTPSEFLKQIIGRPVAVKLNSGVDYRGVLACLDGYMNIALEQTEEYVNSQLKNKYGDAFIRGNNVLYISTQKRRI
ncbi:hypothetical protein JTE90_012850 [Oedothorax gibbosus]|uniref:U6 snRNA-associated Sm-like protein LSm6 n=2 Tax=Oedothorax gibbosus TaxID=931172 RepID=A0AAV6TZH6_9ARAC|nr:hypothetical protein JTE90_012850 [Oedothorax gibbosus]